MLIIILKFLQQMSLKSAPDRQALTRCVGVGHPPEFEVAGDWDCEEIQGTLGPPFQVCKCLSRNTYSSSGHCPTCHPPQMSQFPLFTQKKRALQSNNWEQIWSYKVHVSWNGYFLQQAHFSMNRQHEISMRKLANPNWSHRHFPLYFWSSYAYLINYQSEDSRVH